jgi:NitT/TauT family transport system substrate-binding protein
MRRLFTLLIGASLGVGGCAEPREAALGEGGSNFSESTNISPLDPQPLEQAETIVVSVATDLEGFSALYLADLFGEFEKENLFIEYVTLPSGEALPALALGQVDVSAVGIAATLFNIVAEGAEVRLVFPGPSSSEGDGLWMSTSWLEGATESTVPKIASSQGAALLAVVPIFEWAENRGIDPDAIEIGRLPIAELASALEAGVIDGAWLNSPAHLPFLTGGSAQLVAEYSERQTALGFAFGPRLLTEERDVGLAFTRALLRTQNLWLIPGYKGNPELVAILAERLGKSSDELLLTPELDFLTRFDTRLFDGAQVIWAEDEQGIFSESPLRPEQYLDSSFMTQLYGETLD